MNATLRFLCTLATSGLLQAGIALADATDAVMGTIVAVDATTHTLTLKGDDGRTRTAPLEGTARAKFDALKPGEMVFATFRDAAKGKHEAITTITVVKTVKVFEGS
jgi:hypothetical protein